MDQLIQPNEQDAVPLRRAPEGKWERAPDGSIVASDGSLLWNAYLSVRGNQLLSVELDDVELRQVIEARLKTRPADTLSLIGKAISDTSECLGSVAAHDAMTDVGIDRSHEPDLFSRWPFRSSDV